MQIPEPCALQEQSAVNATGRSPGPGSTWLARGGGFSPPRLLLAASVAGALLLPLVFFRFQRDQAHFAYLALCWLGGRLPYADLFSQQFPGQFLLYAAIFKLLGASEIAVRAVDLVLQGLAGLALAGIVARLTRPLTGLLAAILFAIEYVCLGPVDTSNRETYQIALLLPVIYWLLFGELRPWLDKVAALLAGAVVMCVLLIKPTTGLVLPPLVWMMCSPGTSVQPPGIWRRRLSYAVLGGGLMAALCGGLFAGHFAAAYEFLFTYNLEVYSKLPSPRTIRSDMWSSFAFQGLFLIPFVCFVWGTEERPALLRLLAVQVGLIAAVLVQGRGFHYQTWIAVPLFLLCNTVFIDWLVVRAFAAGGASRARELTLLSSAAVLLLLVLGLPLNQYVGALVDRSPAQGPMAPLWDAAVSWIREHAGPGERVFIFGHDMGVQFLARIPPLSKVPTGVLDLRDDALNAHPLMARLKARLMTDLERDPPEWILVAAYDDTWFSKSGVDSLRAFKPFENFLRERYDVVQPGLASYLIFRRRLPA